MSRESTGSDVSERPRLIRPLVDFLHTEAAGGVALVVAAIVALVWANSPWDASYHDLWTTRLAVSWGERELDLDLRNWINDGLMAIFFFVVGLEIKRELVEGELRDRRRAMLPVCAALGGMLVPALIYAAFNAGGEGSDGWGIPMATDIAMAVGVLSLLGSRVSPSLKLFLLALAIVDDIGAILVIAVFYTDEIHGDALLATVGLVLAVVAMRRWGVRSIAAYVARRRGPVAGAARVGHPRHARRCRARADDADATDPSARAHRRRRAGRRLLVPGGPPDGHRGARVGLGGRVARAPAPPVDELRRRPAVRARQRRRTAERRHRRRRAHVPGGGRRRGRAWWWASSWASRASPGWPSGCGSPGSPRAPLGRASWAWQGSPASASRCRSSWRDWPSAAPSSRTRPRSAILAASLLAAAIGSALIVATSRRRSARS